MTWPTTPIGTTNIDAGTGSPATARADLKSAVDAVNSMIAMGDPFAQHGRLIGVRKFTKADSGSTYTPTVGTTSVLVKAVAAGGGSSGCATTSATQVGIGVGGGGGAYAETFLTSGFAGVTLTIGSGGAAAGAGGGTASSGGNTSFGSIFNLLGGGAGFSLLYTASSNPAVNGVSNGGAVASGTPNILSIKGGSASECAYLSSASLGILGQPGSSPLSSRQDSPVFTSSLAIPAKTFQLDGYGFGGQASLSKPSLAAVTGSVGGDGVIFVYEYA